MEMFSKAAAFSVFAICCAVALMTLVIVELMRPELSRLEPDSENYPAKESTWLSERTFNLLSDGLPGPEGIDPKSNPFKRVEPAAELAASETAGVAPEPPPTPPQPATREISLVYRGLYRSSSGEPFVYLEVENSMKVYPIGGVPASSWSISDANANVAVLKRDNGALMELPFNRKKSLEVPVESRP